MKQVSWPERQRFIILETLLLWEGRTKKRLLREVFSCSRQGLENTIQHYLERYPENFKVDRGACYVTAGFTPRFSQPSIKNYISLLSQQPILISRIPIEDFSIVRKPYSPGIIAPLFHALRFSSGVQMRYQDIKTGMESARRIWPSQLVNTGFRWHIRGYRIKDDDARGAYRDFVLYRFTGFDCPLPSLPKGMEKLPEDIEWNETIKVRLIVNPRIRQNAKLNMIRHEFGFEDHETEKSVSIKKALIKYELERYGINLNAKNICTYRKNMLWVKNEAEVRPYILEDHSLADD